MSAVGKESPMSSPIEWNRRREDRVVVAREILEHPYSYSDAAREWATSILGETAGAGHRGLQSNA